MEKNHGLSNTMDGRGIMCLEAIPWNKTMGCQIPWMGEGDLSIYCFYDEQERMVSPFNAFMTYTSEFRPYAPKFGSKDPIKDKEMDPVANWKYQEISLRILVGQIKDKFQGTKEM